MLTIYKWFRRRWWWLRRYPEYRRNVRALEAQHRLFQDWLDGPITPIADDVWLDAQAQLAQDLAAEDARRLAKFKAHFRKRVSQ